MENLMELLQTIVGVNNNKKQYNQSLFPASDDPRMKDAAKNPLATKFKYENPTDRLGGARRKDYAPWDKAGARGWQERIKGDEEVKKNTDEVLRLITSYLKNGDVYSK
jgi:hypothetical protein